jgi:OmpA-OmpF porin, OOP family
MRFIVPQQRTFLAVACALALGGFSVAVNAQDTDEHALLRDSSGQHVMSGMGLCMHSGFGPAPAWTAGCHPAVAIAPVAYAEKTIAAPTQTIVAAPLAVYETVGFDANVLFDSNKSNLLPAGRASLDSFVGKIRGLEGQSVMAIGYADRMGSADSNQTLSQERVDMVKAYLVSQGVAADRVDTSARGERQPTTWATECKDANNPKNVACMQPDRHVFIEISGSRLVK